MTPEDPRHGTNAGYGAGCRDACCRRGHAAARKAMRDRLYLERRDSLMVDGTGTRRRIEALMALGWSCRQLDEHLGRRPSYVYKVLSHGNDLHLTTAREIAALYDRLCMTIPDTSTPERDRIVTRNRRLAARSGYVVPLAWDDIDTDPAPRHHAPSTDFETLVDEVVVQRVLDGQPRPRKLTNAEAAEVYRRARARGDSTTVIEHRYGLKSERYAGREAS
jgi:hypothetical protein